MRTLKSLDYLLGYLHEDWADDYPDVWSAIEDFALHDVDRATGLRTDIIEAIRRHPTEQGLDQYLFDVGLRYRIAADGWTSHRDWLLALADRVDEILRTTKEHPTAV